MKQILFFVFSLILLLFGEGNAQITYGTLVETFVGKAAFTMKDARLLRPYLKDNSIDWNAELYPLFTICESNAAFVQNLTSLAEININTPLNPLLEEQDIQGALTNQQHINTLLTNINTHITYTSTRFEKLPENIMTVYNIWSKGHFTQSNLILFAESLEHLHGLHGKMAKNFENEIELASAKLKSFEEASNKLAILYSNSNQVDQKITFMNVLGVLELNYVPIQLEIVDHLTKAFDTLNDYHTRRHRWAKFLLRAGDSI